MKTKEAINHGMKKEKKTHTSKVICQKQNGEKMYGLLRHLGKCVIPVELVANYAIANM